MKTKTFILLIGIVFLAGCFIRQRRFVTENKIDVNYTIPAPTINYAELSSSIRYQLDRFRKEGFSSAISTPDIMKYITRKSEDINEITKSNLYIYFDKVDQEYSDALVSAVDKFFAQNKQKKIREDKYSSSDRRNMSSAIMIMYNKNKSDERIAKWMPLLSLRMQENLQTRMTAVDAKQMLAMAGEQAKITTYTKISSDADYDIKSALASRCSDLSWYGAIPSFAIQLVDTIPKKEQSTSAKNYAKVESRVEEIKANAMPRINKICYESSAEFTEYFTKNEILNFISYLDTIVVPQYKDTRAYVTHFTRKSATPLLEGRRQLNEERDKKIKEIYSNNQEKLNKDVFMQTVYNKISADKLMENLSLEEKGILKKEMNGK